MTPNAPSASGASNDRLKTRYSRPGTQYSRLCSHCRPPLLTHVHGRPAGKSPRSNGGDGGLAGELKKILRLASNNEVQQLVEKKEEEAALVKICRAKVSPPWSASSSG